MKFFNIFLTIILAATGLYAIFLFIADFKLIFNSILNIKSEFLLITILLVSTGWMIAFARWNLLLRNSGINIPFKKNIIIYLAGFALGVVPGTVGELIKAQLLKNNFQISRTKTAPIVLIERLYGLIGATSVSIVGAWFLEPLGYIIIVSFCILIFGFILLSSKKLFYLCINFFRKIKITSKFVEPFSDSYDSIHQSIKGKIIILASLLSIIYWLFLSSAVYFILLAFGIDFLDYFNVVSTFASSTILGIASLIPAGLGVTEGSLIGLFTLQGLETSTTIIIAVFIRIFTLWYSVAVGFVALKIIGGLLDENT